MLQPLLLAALFLLPFHAAAAEADPSKPAGYAFAPVFGYDPVPGLLVGGAFFFYPTTDGLGSSGSTMAILAPMSKRGLLTFDFSRKVAAGDAGPLLKASINTLQPYYYGFGNQTRAANKATLHPFRLDLSPGLSWRIDSEFQLSGWLMYAGRTDNQRQLIDLSQEGPATGHWLGGKIEFSHDTRSHSSSPLSGGKRTLWMDSWVLQGSEVLPLQRIGTTLSQFVLLWKDPNIVWANRMDLRAGFGNHSYVTNFWLGGNESLRGFLAQRFRGYDSALASTELRFPIWKAVSGVTFADVGRVWPDPETRFLDSLHPTAGLGLRIGLPPDGVVKMRMDYGFAKDQSGFFFTFHEAF